jgi:UDP-N-acetylmuramoyl-L-alanyl-D-glutamate--2,6-diaminopimelate ligase
MDILADMKAGLTGDEEALVLTIPDRREAIATALKMAKNGDIVLIAGKGHEDYQEIKGVKHHFDDREEVIKAFNK